MSDTTPKEKNVPVWTDTLAGVEVSIYRNVVKGVKLPLYKISRKKWFTEKGEIKSNYTLSRADWAIARLLEADAWKDIGRMARSERAELRAAPKEKAEEVLENVPVEMTGE